MNTLHKKYPAVLLAVGLLALLLILTPEVQALNVDTRGSIALSLSPVSASDADGTAKQEAVAATEFTGRLYRIAAVDEEYLYTPTADFAELAALDLRDFKDKKAEEIRTLAENAAQLAENAAATELTFRGGTAEADNLETGLYLLVVDPFTTSDGVWTMTSEPVLLPVPIVTGTTADGWDGSDNYRVEAALKLNAEKAMTKIRITKQLDDYSALQGPATFVFRVDAVNAKGETAFSNVYSMTFTGAGTQEIQEIEVPVDSAVTVTEVYSGTAYAPDGSGTVTLTARPMEKAEDGTEEIPADNTAGFTNRYTRRRTYGTAVTNAFSYVDGQWQLTQNYSNK